MKLQKQVGEDKRKHEGSIAAADDNFDCTINLLAVSLPAAGPLMVGGNEYKTGQAIAHLLHRSQLTARC